MKTFGVLCMSCQGNDHSLGWRADFYWFTTLQVQNNQQVHELLSHEWMVHGYDRNCLFVVESKKGLFRVTAVSFKNWFSFQWKFWKCRSHCYSVSNSDHYRWLIHTAILVYALFSYWKLQQVERSTWEIMFIINLYETARVTQWSGSNVRDNTDSRLHDGRSGAPVSSDCVPEAIVLPILTRYINLERLAECTEPTCGNAVKWDVLYKSEQGT